jgi:hypothetical protein
MNIAFNIFRTGVSTYASHTSPSTNQSLQKRVRLPSPSNPLSPRWRGLVTRAIQTFNGAIMGLKLLRNGESDQRSSKSSIFMRSGYFTATIHIHLINLTLKVKNF